MFRFISVVLIISLIWQGVAWTTPADSPQPTVRSPQLVDNIYIPEQYGRIGKSTVNRPQSTEKNNTMDYGLSTMDSPTRLTVVLVKDAHCNYEAQRNIAKILDILIKEYGIDLVGVEGAGGRVDPSVIAGSPDAKKRKEVADKYLKKGWLTASEVLAMEKGKDYGFSIYGVEDLRLYLNDLKAFRDVYSGSEGAERFMQIAGNLILSLKDKIYAKDMLDFDKKIKEYRGNRLPLTELIQYLYSIDKAGFTEYPNLRLVLKAILLEKAIDFNKVERERAELIRECEKRLPKEEIEQLVQKSLLYKLGKISSLEYYKYLEKQLLLVRHCLRHCEAKPKQSPARLLRSPDSIGTPRNDRESFSNLIKYIHLTKLHSTIDEDELFKGLDTLIEDIYKRYIKDEITWKLHCIDEQMYLLGKLLKLEITRDELERYRRSDITLDDAVNFIKIQAGTDIDIPAEITKQPEEFYRYALERDSAFIENLTKKMEDTGKDKAVLIVGGFHADGVEGLLQEKGIQVITIAPSITKEDIEAKRIYLERMMDSRFRPEKILEELGQRNAQVPLVTAPDWRSEYREQLKLIEGESGVRWREQLEREEMTEEKFRGLIQKEIEIEGLKKAEGGPASDVSVRIFKKLLKIGRPIKTEKPSISSTGVGDEAKANRNIVEGIKLIASRHVNEGKISRAQYEKWLKLVQEGGANAVIDDLDIQPDDRNVFNINGHKVFVLDIKGPLSVTEKGEQYVSAGLRRGTVYITMSKYNSLSSEELQKTVQHEVDEVDFLRQEADRKGLTFEQMSRSLKNSANDDYARRTIQKAHRYAEKMTIIRSLIADLNRFVRELSNEELEELINSVRDSNMSTILVRNITNRLYERYKWQEERSRLLVHTFCVIIAYIREHILPEYNDITEWRNVYYKRPIYPDGFLGVRIFTNYTTGGTGYYSDPGEDFPNTEVCELFLSVESGGVRLHIKELKIDVLFDEEINIPIDKIRTEETELPYNLDNFFDDFVGQEVQGVYQGGGTSGIIGVKDIGHLSWVGIIMSGIVAFFSLEKMLYAADVVQHAGVLGFDPIILLIGLLIIVFYSIYRIIEYEEPGLFKDMAKLFAEVFYEYIKQLPRRVIWLFETYFTNKAYVGQIEDEEQPRNTEQQYHWTRSEYVTAALKRRAKASRKSDGKPAGIWLSSGDNWAWVCEDVSMKGLRNRTPLKADIVSGVKILEIGSLDGLIKHLERFRIYYYRNDSGFYKFNMRKFFEKVKKKGYGGIHLSQKGFDEVNGITPFHLWGCESTVVFDPMNVIFKELTGEELRRLGWDRYITESSGMDIDNPYALVITGVTGKTSERLSGDSINLLMELVKKKMESGAPGGILDIKFLVRIINNEKDNKGNALPALIKLVEAGLVTEKNVKKVKKLFIKLTKTGCKRSKYGALIALVEAKVINEDNVDTMFSLLLGISKIKYYGDKIYGAISFTTDAVKDAVKDMDEGIRKANIVRNAILDLSLLIRITKLPNTAFKFRAYEDLASIVRNSEGRDLITEGWLDQDMIFAIVHETMVDEKKSDDYMHRFTPILIRTLKLLLDSGTIGKDNIKQVMDILVKYDMAKITAMQELAAEGVVTRDNLWGVLNYIREVEADAEYICRILGESAKAHLIATPGNCNRLINLLKKVLSVEEKYIWSAYLLCLLYSGKTYDEIEEIFQGDNISTEDILKELTQMAHIYYMENKERKGTEVIKGNLDLIVENIYALVLFYKSSKSIFRDRDAFSRILRKIITNVRIKDVLYETGRANDDFEYESTVMMSSSLRHIIMISVHEIMHNILNNEGFMGDEINGKSIHEFLADVAAFAVIVSVGDKEGINEYSEILKFTALLAKMEEHDFKRKEEHQIARVMLQRIFDFIKEINAERARTGKEGISLESHWNDILGIGHEIVRGMIGSKCCEFDEFIDDLIKRLIGLLNGVQSRAGQRVRGYDEGGSGIAVSGLEPFRGQFINLIGKVYKNLRVIKREGKILKLEGFNTRTGEMEILDLEIEQLTEMPQEMKNILGTLKGDSRELVEEIFSRAPEMYRYKQPYEDLFGFALAGHNLIALRESLANDPIALFHEVGEYLLDLEVEVMSFALEGNKLTIYIKNGKQFDILLNEDAMEQAKKPGKRNHYLLRALQRQVFGEMDVKLTSRIKSMQQIDNQAKLGKGKELMSLENWRKGKSPEDILNLLGEIGFFSNRDVEYSRDKLEEVARKLDLEPGQRYLHVGTSCSWVVILLTLYGVKCTYVDVDDIILRYLMMRSKWVFGKLGISYNPDEPPIDFRFLNIDGVDGGLPEIKEEWTDTKKELLLKLRKKFQDNDKNSFDAISMFHVFFQFEDKGWLEPCIKNLLMLIKDGGTIWFTPRTVVGSRLKAPSGLSDLVSEFRKVAGSIEGPSEDDIRDDYCKNYGIKGSPHYPEPDENPFGGYNFGYKVTKRNEDNTQATEQNKGTRAGHDGYHAIGNFSRTIQDIANELGISPNERNEYDIRGFVEKQPNKPYTYLNGMDNTTILRIEEDGILTIIDERFQRNHAGRRRFTVYASSEAKAVHELIELRAWISYAKAKELGFTEEDIKNGKLNEWIAENIQEARRLRDKFHNRALIAEAEYSRIPFVKLKEKDINGRCELDGLTAGDTDIVIAGEGAAAVPADYDFSGLEWYFVGDEYLLGERGAPCEEGYTIVMYYPRLEIYKIFITERSWNGELAQNYYKYDARNNNFSTYHGSPDGSSKPDRISGDYAKIQTGINMIKERYGIIPRAKPIGYPEIGALIKGIIVRKKTKAKDVREGDLLLVKNTLDEYRLVQVDKIHRFRNEAGKSIIGVHQKGGQRFTEVPLVVCTNYAFKGKRWSRKCLEVRTDFTARPFSDHEYYVTGLTEDDKIWKISQAEADTIYSFRPLVESPPEDTPRDRAKTCVRIALYAMQFSRWLKDEIDVESRGSKKVKVEIRESCKDINRENYFAALDNIILRFGIEIFEDVVKFLFKYNLDNLHIDIISPTPYGPHSDGYIFSPHSCKLAHDVIRGTHPTPINMDVGSVSNSKTLFGDEDFWMYLRERHPNLCQRLIAYLKGFPSSYQLPTDESVIICPTSLIRVYFPNAYRIIHSIEPNFAPPRRKGPPAVTIRSEGMDHIGQGHTKSHKPERTPAISSKGENGSPHYDINEKVRLALEFKAVLQGKEPYEKADPDFKIKLDGQEYNVYLLDIDESHAQRGGNNVYIGLEELGDRFRKSKLRRRIIHEIIEKEVLMRLTREKSGLADIDEIALWIDSHPEESRGLHIEAHNEAKKQERNKELQRQIILPFEGGVFHKVLNKIQVKKLVSICIFIIAALFILIRLDGFLTIIIILKLLTEVKNVHPFAKRILSLSAGICIFLYSINAWALVKGVSMAMVSTNTVDLIIGGIVVGVIVFSLFADEIFGKRNSRKIGTSLDEIRERLRHLMGDEINGLDENNARFEPIDVGQIDTIYPDTNLEPYICDKESPWDIFMTEDSTDEYYEEEGKKIRKIKPGDILRIRIFHIIGSPIDGLLRVKKIKKITKKAAEFGGPVKIIVECEGEGVFSKRFFLEYGCMNEDEHVYMKPMIYVPVIGEVDTQYRLFIERLVKSSPNVNTKNAPGPDNIGKGVEINSSLGASVEASPDMRRGTRRITHKKENKWLGERHIGKETLFLKEGKVYGIDFEEKGPRYDNDGNYVLTETLEGGYTAWAERWDRLQNELLGTDGLIETLLADLGISSGYDSEIKTEIQVKGITLVMVKGYVGLGILGDIYSHAGRRRAQITMGEYLLGELMEKSDDNIKKVMYEELKHIVRDMYNQKNMYNQKKGLSRNVGQEHVNTMEEQRQGKGIYHNPEVTGMLDALEKSAKKKKLALPDWFNDLRDDVEIIVRKGEVSKIDGNVSEKARSELTKIIDEALKNLEVYLNTTSHTLLDRRIPRSFRLRLVTTKKYVSRYDKSRKAVMVNRLCILNSELLQYAIYRGQSLKKGESYEFVRGGIYFRCLGIDRQDRLLKAISNILYEVDIDDEVEELRKERKYKNFTTVEAFMRHLDSIRQEIRQKDNEDEKIRIFLEEILQRYMLFVKYNKLNPEEIREMANKILNIIETEFKNDEELCNAFCAYCNFMTYFVRSRETRIPIPTPTDEIKRRKMDKERVKYGVEYFIKKGYLFLGNLGPQKDSAGVGLYRIKRCLTLKENGKKGYGYIVSEIYNPAEDRVYSGRYDPSSERFYILDMTEETFINQPDLDDEDDDGLKQAFEKLFVRNLKGREEMMSSDILVHEWQHLQDFLVNMKLLRYIVTKGINRGLYGRLLLKIKYHVETTAYLAELARGNLQHEEIGILLHTTIGGTMPKPYARAYRFILQRFAERLYEQGKLGVKIRDIRKASPEEKAKFLNAIAALGSQEIAQIAEELLDRYFGITLNNYEITIEDVDGTNASIEQDLSPDMRKGPNLPQAREDNAEVAEEIGRELVIEKLSELLGLDKKEVAKALEGRSIRLLHTLRELLKVGVTSESELRDRLDIIFESAEEVVGVLDSLWNDIPENIKKNISNVREALTVCVAIEKLEKLEGEQKEERMPRFMRDLKRKFTKMEEFNADMVEGVIREIEDSEGFYIEGGEVNISPYFEIMLSAIAGMVPRAKKELKTLRRYKYAKAEARRVFKIGNAVPQDVNKSEVFEIVKIFLRGRGMEDTKIAGKFIEIIARYKADEKEFLSMFTGKQRNGIRNEIEAFLGRTDWRDGGIVNIDSRKGDTFTIVKNSLIAINTELELNLEEVKTEQEIPDVIDASLLVGDDGEALYVEAIVGDIKAMADKGTLRILYSNGNQKKKIEKWLKEREIMGVEFIDIGKVGTEVVKMNNGAVWMLSDNIAHSVTEQLPSRHRVVKGKKKPEDNDLILMSKIRRVLKLEQKEAVKDALGDLYRTYYRIGGLSEEKIKEYVQEAVKQIDKGESIVIDLPPALPVMKAFMLILKYTRETVASAA